jgi:alanine racemase
VARRAVASVNLAAIERNVARLRSLLSAGADLCAVVKADAYGHGAVAAASAAVAGGASGLAVATAEEAAELRRGGLGGRILVLGAISGEELPVALAAGAELVAWDERFLAAVLAARAPGPVRVHVKLDTGMGRLGTRDPARALALARAVVAGAPALELAGAMTHFATADGDLEFVERQLREFSPFVEEVRRLGVPLAAHAANSAATLRVPSSHLDFVRCGIAIYGCDPMNEDPALHGLEPALALRSYVAAVKPACVGDSAGYGRRFVAAADTWLATIPIGYGDGISRLLTNNCDVLIGGRRYPLVGTVSMDNVTVELGAGGGVAIGQAATLIGVDGSERQTAEDLARRAGTISYEVLTAISRRVPRVHHRDGAPA